ncbi:hypothetical protein SAMN06297251_102209 [Fulvimarina manganoxydans]|uniref:Uncharacterized protein n=1 Tax=Fulvimarina manganoxydans TaxID=937218 RepID=A0A1W1Z5S0_9HYPH|nr:hypothetical protein [Fulvimarina manganoxydans]SMC43799.1 hypothetical protein SAMN06297251_102209 [Fulvimarina manganoxydans]
MRKDAVEKNTPSRQRHPGGRLSWWIGGVVAVLLLLAVASGIYAEIMTVQFEDRVPGSCYWTDALVSVVVCEGFPGAKFESFIRNFGMIVFQFGIPAPVWVILGISVGEFRPLLALVTAIGAIVFIAWMLRAVWVLVRRLRNENPNPR